MMPFVPVVVALIAGVCAVLSRTGSARRGAFAVVAIGALAALGLWVAFGPGVRVCTANVPFFPAAETGGLGCRIPFGIGAVVTTAVALYAAVDTWARAFGRTPGVERARRVAEGVLLLSLAPLLIPLFLFLALWGLWDTLVSRVSERRVAAPDPPPNRGS